MSGPAPIGCTGLCQRHYKQAMALVHAGRSTWEELEAQGRARPPSPEHVRRYRRGRGRWGS
jgi:hypothetical protein